jgi:hypothetical protein
MLDELESQNDDQASEMSKKIKMLKGVSQCRSEEIGGKPQR